MDSKLRAQVLTMAAATLGLSLVGGCAKKTAAEPAQAGEAAEEAEGGEHSCSASGKKAHEGEGEGGGEHACGGGSCGASEK